MCAGPLAAMRPSEPGGAGPGAGADEELEAGACDGAAAGGSTSTFWAGSVCPDKWESGIVGMDCAPPGPGLGGGTSAGGRSEDMQDQALGNCNGVVNNTAGLNEVQAHRRRRRRTPAGRAASSARTSS